MTFLHSLFHNADNCLWYIVHSFKLFTFQNHNIYFEGTISVQARNKPIDILALSVLRITFATQVLSYTATMLIKGNKHFDGFFQLLTCTS